MQKRCAAMVPLLALAIASVPASAPAAESSQVNIPVRIVEASDLPNVSLGIHLGFQDLHAAIPSLTPTPVFSGVTGGAVLNIGFKYKNRLGASSPWHVLAGGEVGFGGTKDEFSGTPANKFEEKFSSWAVRGGLEYVQPITPSVSIYGGGRLFYSSSKVKWDDGTNEEEGEPFNVFGFEPAMGCTHRFNEKLGMFGEFYNQFGWGSTEVGRTKYTETVKYGCWRGGLLFHL